MERLQARHSLLVTVALAVALGVTASAGVLYTTDFPDPGGVMPTGWSALVGDEGNPGWHWDGDDFRFNQGGVKGVAHYTGPLTEGSSTALEDFTIVTELRKTVGPVAGIAGRIQNANTYYHARLRGANQLEIYRLDGGSATQLGPTVIASDNYDSGETWRLATTFDGPIITARLFNDNGVHVGTAQATDGTYTSGSAGLRGQNPNAFESYTIKTPPTPQPPSLLAYEGFPTTDDGAGDAYEADTTLRNTNEPRLGFTGEWRPSGGFATAVDASTRSAGLSWPSLANSPGSLELFRDTSSTSPSSQVKSLTRDFDYTFEPEDDVWASFLFSYEGFGEANGGSVAVAEFGSASGANRFVTFRIDSDGAVAIEGGGNDGDTLGLGTAAAGKTHLVVFRAAPSLAGPNDYYDALSAWLDPDPAVLGDPDAEGFALVRHEWPELGTLLAFDELRLRWRPQPPGYSFTFDEFRLGTGPGMVLPSEDRIPEPGSLALLALGALGLWRRRRR